MRVWKLVLLVLSLVPCQVAAGPNAEGTLLVHDTGLVYTTESNSYPSPPPTIDPPTVDSNVSPGIPAGGRGWVWKVYAAFPDGNSPRLKALGFMTVFSANVFVVAGGLPDPAVDFEIPQDGWPMDSGGSDGIAFGTVQTGQVDEVYWFAGYSYLAGETWSTAEHVNSPDRMFVDDAIPPNEDPIAGYSSIGFGVDGQTVYPQPVPQRGACCFADGHCSFVLEASCPTGDWRMGVPCDPNPCPQPPLGACCFPDGLCQYLPEVNCPQQWLGEGSVCDPNPCPQPTLGACCFPDGLCQYLPEVNCPQQWLGEGSVCDPNPCPQPTLGACCFPDGLCQYLPEVNCPQQWLGEGSVCDPNPCPQPPFGACCFPDGHCQFLQQMNCPQQWLGEGSVCEPSPCPQPRGACCFPDGHCEYVEQTNCQTGDWRVNVVCDPNPCPAQPGYENEGGVLVVHDTGLAYTDGNDQYPSPPPSSCDQVDNMAPPGSAVVWKVYAAFPEVNSPRLKAVAFGEDFNPGLVTIYAAGLPSEEDFEVPESGWPDTPGGAVGIAFGQTQTDHIVEVHWFGGYGSQYGVWRTAPHPAGITEFVDDSVPPVVAPIAGLGSIGFGVPGETPCGVSIPGGACCFPVGTCVMLAEDACAEFGGSYQGGDCTPNPCPEQPSGACCFPDGHCEYLQQLDCSQGWLGEGSACDPNPCPPPAYGACCYASGACGYTVQANCPTGDWRIDVPCEPNPCLPSVYGACCYPDGSCVYTYEANCPTGDWRIDVPCDPNPCPGQPSPGACCLEEVCIVLTPDACAAEGGVFIGGWCYPSVCSPTPIERTTWGQIKARFR